MDLWNICGITYLDTVTETLMASWIYPGSRVLATIIYHLESVQADQYAAPDIDSPCNGKYVGVLTENQRALLTLLELSRSRHTALHDELELKFGANTNLTPEHRALHVMETVLVGLLGEDLVHTYPEIHEQPTIIDRDWQLFIVPSEETEEAA